MRYVLSVLWQFFTKIFKKKKENLPSEKEAEEEVEEEVEEEESEEVEEEEGEESLAAAGEIKIVWSEGGDFQLYVDVFEINQDNAEVLALLLHNLNDGEMLTYFLQALQKWCEDNADRSLYVGTVFDVWKMLEDHTNNSHESLAVHASDVFNLKGPRGNERR